MPSNSTDYARFVIISANVESLMKEPGKIAAWAQAVGREVAEQKPVFAAIHLQGVKSSSDDVIDQLTRDLDGQPGFELFTHSRHFHDPNKLGLSNIYYATDSPKAAIYDQQRKEYRQVEGHRNEHADSSFIKKDRLQESANFSDQTPCYAMTRWLLFDKPFNYANLLLTADQTPLDGCQKWPSESAQLRHKQLTTIIDSLQTQNLWDEDATFLAGDFNCSLNKKKFLEDQMKSNHAALTENDTLSNTPKMEASNLNGKKIFSLNAKKFDMLDMHDWLFNTCNGQLVRKYDQELSDLKNNGRGLVAEHPIYFQPNWPLDFDRKSEKDFYPRTKCPAWRSRILTNQKAWDMMHKNSFSGSSVYYGIIGKNLDIGEHKPVSLIATICLK